MAEGFALEFDASGLQAADAALQAMQEEIGLQVSGLAVTLGEFALEKVQGLSPVRTGHLRDAWELEMENEADGSVAAEVSSSMEDDLAGSIILKSLERGHKAYTVTPLLDERTGIVREPSITYEPTWDEPPRWLHFTSAEGDEVFTKEAHIPDTRPGLGMLRQAADAVEDRISIAVIAAVERIGRAWSGEGGGA